MRNYVGIARLTALSWRGCQHRAPFKKKCRVLIEPITRDLVSKHGDNAHQHRLRGIRHEQTDYLATDPKSRAAATVKRGVLAYLLLNILAGDIARDRPDERRGCAFGLMSGDARVSAW